MSNQLPVARLRPRGGADQLAIARGHARTGARAAGRFALFATRAVATIAVCGAGLYMVGAGMRPHSSYDDLNRRLDQMRQMNESTLRRSIVRCSHARSISRPITCSSRRSSIGWCGRT
jgi:hypothetical protein